MALTFLETESVLIGHTVLRFGRAQQSQILGSTNEISLQTFRWSKSQG